MAEPVRVLLVKPTGLADPYELAGMFRSHHDELVRLAAFILGDLDP